MRPSEQTDDTRAEGEKFPGSYISFFSIPTGLAHAQCLLESLASVGLTNKRCLKRLTHTRGRTHTKTYIESPSRRCFLLFAF